jgi:hypothetical protein
MTAVDDDVAAAVRLSLASATAFPHLALSCPLILPIRRPMTCLVPLNQPLGPRPNSLSGFMTFIFIPTQFFQLPIATLLFVNIFHSIRSLTLSRIKFYLSRCFVVILVIFSAIRDSTLIISSLPHMLGDTHTFCFLINGSLGTPL